MKTRAIVATLLGVLCASSVALCTEPTTVIPANAPPLAGFSLGQSLADAMARLGIGPTDAPTGANATDVRVLERADKSLSLVATQDQGLTVITLRRHDANGLLGIHVGDPCLAPQAAWGKPSARGENNALWNFGAWIAQVHCDDDGNIATLTIGL